MKNPAILALTLSIPLSLHADILAVPHPQCTFDAKHTVIWTPLFQAAWDELTAAHQANEKPKTEPPNQVIEWLDGFTWKKDDVLPKGAWSVVAGPSSPELYEKANQEAGKLGIVNPFQFNPSSVEGGYAALASMLHKVSFSDPFSPSKDVPLTFKTKDKKEDVRFFGTPNGERFKNVKVIHYNPRAGSFALEAKCKGGNDRVIFYLPAKSGTFADACKNVLLWKNRKDFQQEDGSLLDVSLQNHEEVRIPYLSVHCSADFSPLLQGMRKYENERAPFFISKANQKLFFQLDEKGARVEATVEIAEDPFGDREETYPRLFHFNRPFYTFLWRDQAEWPYLALWLGDTSAMQVFPK